MNFSHKSQIPGRLRVVKQNSGGVAGSHQSLVLKHLIRVCQTQFFCKVFRAVANNLELLNFALNFYIYCLCR